MSTIRAGRYKTKYSASAHLVFCIDGRPLDVLLAEMCAADALIGLVPAPSWLWRDEDRALALRRLFPAPGATVIAPVLVCPDDRDFFCTVVVAQVHQSGAVVTWQHIGLDRTRSGPVGSVVDWFAGVGPFQFALGAYQACLAKLQAEQI
jgi:hypothetical protein